MTGPPSCLSRWRAGWIIGLVLTMGAGPVPPISGQTDSTAMSTVWPPSGTHASHVELGWPGLAVYIEHLAQLTATEALARGLHVEVPVHQASVLAGLRGYAGHVALVRTPPTNHLVRLHGDHLLIGCGASSLCRPGAGGQPERRVFLEFRNLSVTRQPGAGTMTITADGLFHSGPLQHKPDGEQPMDGADDSLPPIAFRVWVRSGPGGTQATLNLEPGESRTWTGPFARMAEWFLGPDRADEVLASGLLTGGWQAGDLSITTGEWSE